MAGHHHHVNAGAGDKRIGWAIGVNLFLTLAQVVGGIVSGRLALIADALHNFSDAISLVIAFGARYIGRRPADATMTFGYVRAEIVAALINYTTLALIGLYLVYEAVMRFVEPQPTAGWTVVIVAGMALVVDVVTAFLTYAMSKTSMNVRAAFLHNHRGRIKAMLQERFSIGHSTLEFETHLAARHEGETKAIGHRMPRPHGGHHYAD